MTVLSESLIFDSLHFLVHKFRLSIIKIPSRCCRAGSLMFPFIGKKKRVDQVPIRPKLFLDLFDCSIEALRLQMRYFGSVGFRVSVYSLLLIVSCDFGFSCPHVARSFNRLLEVLHCRTPSIHLAVSFGSTSGLSVSPIHCFF